MRLMSCKTYSIESVEYQHACILDNTSDVGRRISTVVLSRWKKEFLEWASEVYKKGPSESEKELEQSKEHI